MYMKTDNQALRLERLMQKHQRYPEYQLCFPPVYVKKNVLKKMAAGDIFLLGMAQMEMLLISEYDGCAKAILSSCGESMTIEIMETIKPIENAFDSKKYKKVDIVLGTLRSRVLEARHKIESTLIDPEEISLYFEKKKIASAKLVMVDDEIAAEIKEVNKT